LQLKKKWFHKKLVLGSLPFSQVNAVNAAGQKQNLPFGFTLEFSSKSVSASFDDIT